MRSAEDHHKFDHVVTVLFEHRSFDNLLGRLYEPNEVSAFEGVIGKALSNPIPEWAEHGAEREFVPYGVAANMDVPNPDCEDDFAHVNRQLFGVTEPRRGHAADSRKQAAWLHLPADPRRIPTMDGFVTDYIIAFIAEIERQPTYREYAQIMTGYAPRQVPVMSTVARGFATFDHWFCDVPSETLPNRSFCHAGTSSGFVADTPYMNFLLHNDAETIFERLDAAGLTWRVYVDPCMRCSVTGMIHAPRLAERFATNFSSLDDFFEDAEDGRLPAYSLIEPCLMHGHNDYHPALSGVVPTTAATTRSSILGGEQLLARVYTAVRTSTGGEDRSNFANTLLLVGFDAHGGTYDHIVPPRVAPPDPSAPAGQMGFRFDRAGLRVPAVAVSAYIEPRTVIATEYRNTSIIRTLMARWPLGPPLTARDATASDIAPILTRSAPRPPEDWPDVTPRPMTRHHRAHGSVNRRLPPMGQTLLGLMIALDTHYTGHVPDLDPETATAMQATEYLNERSPRFWPGLYAHAA
jgi:phospholipase C